MNHLQRFLQDTNPVVDKETSREVRSCPLLQIWLCSSWAEEIRYVLVFLSARSRHLDKRDFHSSRREDSPGWIY